MKNYIKHHPWQIIEEGFREEYNRVSESIFSTGNGIFGQRGNFEETFTGDTLQGTYVAGVYYPDKTRVGWWKNGYPEYFAKVLNAPNWVALKLKINGEVLDLNNAEILEFKRVLNMYEGVLYRTYTIKLQNGITVTASIERFCSLSHSNTACLNYTLACDADATIEITSLIDGDVHNEDSNFDEFFWNPIDSEAKDEQCTLLMATKKTDFHAAYATNTTVSAGSNRIAPIKAKAKKKQAAIKYEFKAATNEPIVISKRAIMDSSLNIAKDGLWKYVQNDITLSSKDFSYEELKDAHKASWAAKWNESDIKIEGDVAAQQAVRFNIFQLNCTYTGEDERLNIGPKGFTGEKYGGSTYWDTEAYCLPFYQATADSQVAKNLLIYRYKHLDKAIENAAKLGFTNGAALYPMVTMNGEECHNEWEITFEEIHRNGAIAYAIYDYINYTQDQDYLAEYGLEVLIGIARFWVQRVNWSEDKKKYVMLGVTGPNEFENNVNNNWYTNKIAAWCLSYAKNSLEWVQINHPKAFDRICEKTNWNAAELEKWTDITNEMYYPYSEEHGVYLQQDGFLDKELIPVSELDESQRPIVEHWSWDRILRSCYIKQADTLQGFYFFEDEFSLDEHRRHFNFYEPLTVHESSLSPCVHSILAAKIGDKKRAYEFYLRTARLDLDDYNNDTRDGLHITSMAGTWMSIVKGFAGMRVKNGELKFNPFIPDQWESFSFKIRFNGQVKLVKVTKEKLEVIDTETSIPS